MKKGIVGAVSAMAGAAAGAAASNYFSQKIITQNSAKVDKFKTYYNMLNQWLILKHEGKGLESYFQEKDYHTIAIYGMGEMGNRLYEELEGSSVTVKYAVDKNAASAYSELEVLDPDDDLKKVDAIIVTAVFAMEEVEELLSEKVDFPVISLEDVVYEA